MLFLISPFSATNYMARWPSGLRRQIKDQGVLDSQHRRYPSGLTEAWVRIPLSSQLFLLMKIFFLVKNNMTNEMIYLSIHLKHLQDVGKNTQELNSII